MAPAVRFRPIAPGFRRQGGAAIVEFAAGGALVLALGLAALETAYWQIARQVAAVALLEAARAGTTGHADPAAMAGAFETAIRPLHAAGLDGPAAITRVRQVHVARQASAGLSAWHIRIVSPHAGHFADFAQTGAGPGGQRAIVAIYQHEQHQDHARQWPAGRGPRSGDTIFQANVLHLRLRYAHAPLTPLPAILLRALRASASAGDPGGQALAAAGYLPIVHDVSLAMHSAAVQWPAWSGQGGSISRRR